MHREDQVVHLMEKVPKESRKRGTNILLLFQSFVLRKVLCAYNFQKRPHKKTLLVFVFENIKILNIKIFECIYLLQLFIALFHYDVTSKKYIVLMLRIMVARGDTACLNY